MRTEFTTITACVVLHFVILPPAVSGQEVIWHQDGEATADLYGYSVACAGDVDRDGTNDFLVGALGHNSYMGQVYLFSGRTGGLLQSFLGENVGDNFCFVAGIGDVDGDSHDDFLIGANTADFTGNDAGRAYVISGASQSTLFTLDGLQAGNLFGSSLTGLGDVNHDGVPDFAIGAPAWTNIPGLRGTGQAYVYSGMDASLLYVFQGESDWDNFSDGLCAAGDVDHDGYADIVVGASLDFPTEGRYYLLSGQDGSEIRTLEGQYGDGFAATVANVGDIDRDGIPDHAATAVGEGTGIGAVHIISGATGQIIQSMYGDPNNARGGYGYSVAGAGDMNGDGWPDVIVGAPQYNMPTNQAGRAFLYSGRNGALLYTFRGEKPGDWLGHSLAGVGDLNDDGFDDVLVGALSHDGAVPDTGGAYVFAGNDLWLEAQAKNNQRLVHLHTRGGPQGGIGVVALLDVAGRAGGGPHFVSQGRLDQNGDRSITLNVPPLLRGYPLTFQSYATHSSRAGVGGAPKVEWINSAKVTVQVKP